MIFLDLTNPFLLLQESVLNELVDEGEDDGVGESLGLKGRTGREGEEDPGGEEIEKRSRCKNVPPHVLLTTAENFPEHCDKFVVERFQQ